LILDNNDIGRVGADALGRILSESRQLKLLSLENCRLAGNDIEGFSKALATNKVLKVLNLGCNRLGDLGMDHLCDALCDNTSLEHLDLFDCHFTNLGGTYLEHVLKHNKSLRWLRLANTQVNVELAELIVQTVIDSSVRTFRWVNLLPIRSDYFSRSSLDKLIQVEYRVQPVTRSTYVAAQIGDLATNLLKDVYLC